VNITTTAGDLLVAFCRESSSGTDNFSVTDSAGQTWTQTTSGYKNEGTSGPRSGMFYVANSAAVTSVTVNYTTPGGVTKPGIMVFEISGAASSGVADGSVNNGTAASTTTSTSGSLTTSNANDMLILATDTSGDETGWTAGAGYTIPNNSVRTGSSGSNVRMAMQYQVVASPQTNASAAMTYANSNWNGNIFAAFKGGTSTSGPPASLTPTSLTFASQTVSSTSAAQAVALQNGTSSPLSISSIGFTGANSGDFAQTNNCGASLAAGASCSIDVTFTPTAVGTRTATLTVTDTASNSPQTASVTGTGAGLPGLSPSPVPDFGNQNVGATSAAQAVTLSNPRSAERRVANNGFTGTNPGDFGQTNNCPLSPSTLAANGSCTINVTFTPTATGSRSATLTVTDDASTSPQTAGVSGTGVSLPALSPSPVPDFGNQNVGTTSAAQAVTLSNPTATALTITSIGFTGTNPGDFGQTNNCPLSPSTLAANGTCTINVTFTPTATGARSATLNVTDNASNSPQTSGVSGTGTSPPSLSPTSLTFGNQNVGATSAAQAVTLSNPSGAALTITSIGFTGTNPGDFGQTNTCPLSPSTLAVNATCTINVTFTPTVTGSRSATLTVTDNASNSPQTAGVSGTGIAPPSLSPASLNFGNQSVGLTSAAPATGSRSATLTVTDNASNSPQTAGVSGTGAAPTAILSPTSLSFSRQNANTTSPPKTVTLSNAGNAPLTINSITITGTNANNFALTSASTRPLGGGTLNAQTNCTLSATFTPTSNGSKAASVPVTDNANGVSGRQAQV